MAERSKAPDSRDIPFLCEYENSGPQMRAWVRIPLLTRICFLKSSIPISNLTNE